MVDEGGVETVRHLCTLKSVVCAYSIWSMHDAYSTNDVDITAK